MKRRAKHAAPYDPSKDAQPSEGYTYCDQHHSCFHNGCRVGACGDGNIGTPAGHCNNHENDCHMGC